jgi:glycosyltransferase involved in cell wall biosynthesis
LNIGIDIKAFKNGRTGIARYLRTIMDRLQKIDEKNNYFLFECTPSDYKIINPKWKKVLIPWKLPGIFWLQLLLPRTLKKQSIDLFWAAEQICPLRHRGTTVTTVYDLTALRYPETCQPSNRLIQRFLFPPTIRRSDMLLPISDFIGREVLYYYPALTRNKQITTIACGIPEWEFDTEGKKQEREQFLFFAGNMEPRKNLLRLLDALEILKSNGREIPLHIAGPTGWKNSDLHRKINSGPLKNSLHFLGYITEEQLQEQYRTCSAVVYPSLYEGFGLPILEAVCMEARIITSRGTVMEEIAGDTAYYFDPFDSSDMARTIERVLAEPHPTDRWHYSAQRVLDSYSWERSARKLLEVFSGFQCDSL